MEKWTVTAANGNLQARSGNDHPLFIVVSVEDANGAPVPGLTVHNFNLAAEVTGSGLGFSETLTVSAGLLPGVGGALSRPHLDQRPVRLLHRGALAGRKRTNALQLRVELAGGRGADAHGGVAGRPSRAANAMISSRLVVVSGLGAMMRPPWDTRVNALRAGSAPGVTGV
jgi:hypothetical protein